MEIQNKVSEYFKNSLANDLRAGAITAIVGLPLAIAFAIASGVEPQMGLYTAIIAGMLVSATGGSKYSISGPSSAMTVITLSTLHSFGLEGILLAGFVAGVFQVSFGLLKLGKFVKYIPLPVISGFTSGIGAMLLIGQIPNAFGLVIESKEQAWETIYAVISNINNISRTATVICIGTVLLLLYFPVLVSKIRIIRSLPPSIIALVLSTLVVFRLNTDIPLVGNIPSGLPQIQMLNFDLELLIDVLPAAFTIALLGTIQSLLCAVVCDGMTNSKHDSNRELVGQGIANMTLPFFSGIAGTGAIARTAINIREGAKTQMAGIFQSLILLIILLYLGPIAAFIPKAYLAGVLIVVSMRMINVDEFKTTMNISKMDSTVLLVTFVLTVLTNLVFAAQIGMFLSIVLLFVRLTNVIDIQTMENYDKTSGINATIFADPYLKNNVLVYTINGPFFFGAMNVFESKINEHMNISKPHIILRMRYVPFIDATGMERLKSFIRSSKKQRQKVYLTSIQPEVMRIMENDWELTELMKKQHVHVFDSTQEALEFVKEENENKKNKNQIE
ncbi:SulP family inorganic anion transporter [Methanolobus sediminis]|uniref:SulP family inorganic anion transporter n=1 Tax=Methanolobus sediminis TaxID=3072978 RepID=A0AA51UK51_9EURY|nr:SulP family inorganic anion transporter [Methanolobus sediminis]WMW23821.1 SulP family inorganic anion transporter [Methanolobus sediminis]